MLSAPCMPLPPPTETDAVTYLHRKKLVNNIGGWESTMSLLHFSFLYIYILYLPLCSRPKKKILKQKCICTPQVTPMLCFSLSLMTNFLTSLASCFGPCPLTLPPSLIGLLTDQSPLLLSLYHTIFLYSFPLYYGDEGSRLVQNVGKFLRGYKALHYSSGM